MAVNGHTLTALDVLNLRASVRWRVNDGSVRPEPHVIYAPADRVFVVWTGGRPMASSPDPAIACYLLVQERAEPGWIARLLDTTIDPETAALDDPAARAARLSAIRSAAALARTNTTTNEANRRLQALRPTSVSLDDLLEDPMP